MLMCNIPQCPKSHQRIAEEEMLMLIHQTQCYPCTLRSLVKKIITNSIDIIDQYKVSI
jgi:hypothetical protein